jgi:hypothetical protein
MQVLEERGFAAEGGDPVSFTFAAQRDVEYKVRPCCRANLNLNTHDGMYAYPAQVEMIPSDELVLSALQVLAPHSHHVMASRFDASSQGSGRKVLQWTGQCARHFRFYSAFEETNNETALCMMCSNAR